MIENINKVFLSPEEVEERKKIAPCPCRGLWFHPDCLHGDFKFNEFLLQYDLNLKE